MPQSKRAKVIHLSKVQKKGKEHTQRIFDEARECALKHHYIYVFRVDNMRNNYLKDVRQQFPDSRYVRDEFWIHHQLLEPIKTNLILCRLFFGKTKVLAKALGSTPEEEVVPGVSQLAKHLHGLVGLLFSPQLPSDVLSFFDEFRRTDYSRAFALASRTFTIPEGIVYSRGGEISQEEDVPLAHSLEPTVRKWGLPTRLVKGKVMLEVEGGYTVCKEGDILSSDQTALLKCFGVALAEFKVIVEA